MTRTLLILRPEPGASETADAVRAMGLRPVVAPLFEVRPLDWTLPDRLPDAVLMTSANAARHGGAQLAALRHLPLYAVGEATAAAAKAAGFANIVIGDAGIEAIVSRAAADGTGSLLHLAGREHKAPDDAPNLIERRIVYASDAVAALPDTARAALPDAIALLHSPRAAALFASMVDPAPVAIAAISPAALAAAGPGWRATALAVRPDDASLLAAAAKLCDQAAR
jgi:uroporphyrinogen-III synthase